MKLVGDGFVLLLLGQLVVFCFLGLMVLYIRSAAAAIQRFSPGAKPVHGPEIAHADPAEDEEAVAVAVAAVQHHRNRL